MVRTKYTRVIVKKARKRWAAHIESFLLEATNFAAATINGASIATYKTLAVTQIDAATPTPNIIKTGRYSASYNFIFDLSSSNNKSPLNYMVTILLMYIPQGWPLDVGSTSVNHAARFNQFSNLVGSHPEWIIAKKQLGDWNQIPGATDGVYDCRTGVLSSKLKRNLNSGDQVAIVAMVQKAFTDQVNFPYSIKFQGQVSYFTTTL